MSTTTEDQIVNNLVKTHFAARREERRMERNAVPPLKGTVDDAIARLEQYGLDAQQRRLIWEEWALSQPQSLACLDHLFIRTIDFDNSSRETYAAGVNKMVYYPCPKCALETKWIDRGIDLKYIGATLDELVYDTKECRDNLQKAREFVKAASGFLILLGNPGNGKTHIAAAILQMRGKGFFCTQGDLLAKHRDRYDDKKAINVEERAKAASCFVLDEAGFTVGGRDEAPLLHRILNHRYASKLPTIITSNLDEDEFWSAMGDRIQDRYRECTRFVLRFHEASKRSQARQAYLN